GRLGSLHGGYLLKVTIFSGTHMQICTDPYVLLLGIPQRVMVAVLIGYASARMGYMQIRTRSMCTSVQFCDKKKAVISLLSLSVTAAPQGNDVRIARPASPWP